MCIFEIVFALCSYMERSLVGGAGVMTRPSRWLMEDLGRRPDIRRITCNQLTLDTPESCCKLMFGIAFVWY